MMEKRPNRRQTGVACLDRVLPLLLELVQKSEDEVPVEVFDGQRTWLTPGTLGSEKDQHTQGVAIAGDG